MFAAEGVDPLATEAEVWAVAGRPVLGLRHVVNLPPIREQPVGVRHERPIA